MTTLSNECTKRVFFHGTGLWDTKSVVNEVDRVALFMVIYRTRHSECLEKCRAHAVRTPLSPRAAQERHGAWPDPKWLEKETPAYSARMDERTKEVMRHMSSQKRCASARVVSRRKPPS